MNSTLIQFAIDNVLYGVVVECRAVSVTAGWIIKLQNTMQFPPPSQGGADASKKYQTKSCCYILSGGSSVLFKCCATLIFV